MNAFERFLSRKPPVWLPVALFVLGALVVWFSPGEATLGGGIKPVYVHVGFTWTGMLLLLLSALLGVLQAVRPRPALDGWLRLVYAVGLCLFAVGFALSLVASTINWGGIPIREPRFLMAANVTVIGLLVWAFSRFVWRHPRLHGLLSTVPALFLLFSGRPESMVLHPENPVQSSPLGIKATFYIMLALTLLLAAWLMAYFFPRTE